MAKETSSMYCALFGSMAVIHSVTPRRHICGTVIEGESGWEGSCIPLDEGVHLHRAGEDVIRPAKRPAAGAAFVVVIC